MSESRRRYRQFCGVAKALDLVGERWTLLVVRDLLLGPRRYGQLLEALPGLTTNLLAKRLKQLEQDGLLERSGAGRGAAYQLTELGRALEPVVFALGTFGERWLDLAGSDGDRFDVRWLMTSAKRRSLRRPAEPDAPVVRVTLRVAGQAFHAATTAPGLHLADGPDPVPDATVIADDPRAFVAWTRGWASLRALEEAGRVRVEGDRAAVEALGARLVVPDGHG